MNHHQPNQEKLTFLSSADLQSVRNQEPSFRCRRSRMTPSLFSRLFIASRMRDGDLDDVFAHENQACPPALSQMGKMRLGKKSVLVGCLEDMIPHKRMLLVLMLKSSSLMEQLSPTCWHLVVRRPSLTMQHMFSCRTSHLSYSMQSEWMSSGMNTCQTV